MSSLPASTLRRADASRPSTSDVRRTACSLERGSCSPTPPRRRLLRQQAPGVGLRVPEPDEDVLDPPPDPLVLGQPAEHRLTRRQPGGHVAEAKTRDLFDDVDLASDVPSAPGGNRHLLAADAEPQPPQDRVLLVRRGLDAEHGVGSLGAKADHRRLRQPGVDVGVTDPARTRELDDELRGELRRLLGEIGVDALLPAVRAFGAEPQPLRRAEDRVRLEVRGLEQDLGRLLADLRLLAAHDSRERDRALTSAIIRSYGSSSRSTPSSVRSFSPGLARVARRSCRRQASRSRTRAAGCRARA